jgi:cobaltochelatase CobN
MSALCEKRCLFFVSDVQFDAELMTLSTVNQNDYQTISQYFTFGGEKNFENLFGFLTNHYANFNIPVILPKQLSLEGIYYPQLGCIQTLDEYLQKKYVPNQPTVGVFLGQDPLKSGDTSFVDCLVDSIERHQANALAVFFSVVDPTAKSLRWIVGTTL